MGPGAISGGFYITRAIPRPTGLGTALLPVQILSLSNCLTEIVPDWWALEWACCSREERLAAMSKAGLRDEALPAIVRLATDAFDRGELGWPCVWQSLQAARAARAAIDGLPPEFMILELGVPQEQAAALIAELEPPPRVGECGLLTRLKVGRALETSGVTLGWEVLGVEAGGSFHSWLCNAIHEDAHNQLGITPGNLGLLSESDARSVEALIEGGLGAEPVPWFRGLLNRLE